MLKRMTISPLYQKVVTELEKVLSPRVVSRSLNEALKHHAKTPETVTYEDLAKVLKEDVARQLQLSLSPEKAKTKVEDLLKELRAFEEEASLSSVLGPQSKALSEIQNRLKAFSLYFDWPETQKLKAQLQLIEQELAERHNANELLLKAREQLDTIEQKHADLLLDQSEELAKLEEGYELISKLEDSKVRRLLRLLEHIKQAQNSKQILIAERERAFSLLNDLKAVAIDKGFSLRSDDELADKQPQKPNLPAAIVNFSEDNFDGLLLEVNDEEDKEQQLLLLQLADERRRLEHLFDRFQNLLDYRSDLSAQLKQAQKNLYLNQRLGKEIDRLGELLEEAYNEMQESLKAELQGIEDSMQTMHQALDTKLLGQALFVTQHMLGNVLPPKADVKEIRDHHKLLMKQTYALGEVQQRARRGVEHKLEQQAEALAEFKATFQDYAKYVDAESRRRLSEIIQLLEASQVKRELAPEAISEAHRLAAVFEASALMQSHDERLTQRAQLGQLALQIKGLPRLEECKKRLDEASAYVQTMLDKLNHETLSQEEYERCELLVSRLKNDIAIFYRQQLDRFGNKAKLLGNTKLLAIIQEARASLAEGNYPESSELERELELAVDRRLGEELAELHQLEAERRRLSAKETDVLKQFDVLLADIRSQLEKGQLSPSLEHAWLLLSQLRDGQDTWARSFLPRLDKLMNAFPQVARLNTSASFKLSRLLQRLAAQRADLGKLSASAQERFDIALQKAEQRLRVLEEDFHLTRVVAGRLAFSNVLDNLLGSPAPSSELNVSEAPEALLEFDEDAFIALDHDVTQLRSDNPMLNEWLDDYLADNGVRDMMMLDAKGKMLAGCSHQDSHQLYKALLPLKETWQALGQEFFLGHHRLVTLETNNLVLVALWLKNNYTTLVILDNPHTLNPVMNKLRRDLPAIGRILSETSVA